MTWTAADVWCSSWLASYSSCEGTQAHPEQEHVILSGGVFSTKKGLGTFRGNIVPVKQPPCSKRSPQLSLHLTYQSTALSQTCSFHDKDVCVYFSHMKNKKNYKTESLFFLHFCKANTPICLAEIFNSSSRFPIAPLLQYIAGYNLTLVQKKIAFIMPHSYYMLPTSYRLELMN